MEETMKAIDIRNKYLEFFKKHGHKVIPSAPLIPENDPSVLFTTAGMQPLVPYLLGEKHPEGTRLTEKEYTGDRKRRKWGEYKAGGKQDHHSTGNNESDGHL